VSFKIMIFELTSASRVLFADFADTAFLFKFILDKSMKNTSVDDQHLANANKTVHHFVNMTQPLCPSLYFVFTSVSQEAALAGSGG